MFKTHRMFIIFLSLILFYFIKVNFETGLFFLIVAVIASMIPDIDNPTSKLGKNIKLVGYLFKHRGFFHSLLALFIFSYIFSLFFSTLYATAFFLGYLSHILLDSITKKGVFLFYPFSLKARGPFKTNSLFEKFIFIILTIAVIMLIVPYLFYLPILQ